jgi:methanogenic corrinoid protein MtbC1
VTQLSAAGYSLAELARRPTSTLARLAAESDLVAVAPAAAPSPHADDVARMVEHARALDTLALRAALAQAVLDLGPIPAMDGVLSPFLAQLGEGWACGDVSVAEEHVASNVTREVLGWLLQNATHGEHAPTLIATTVAGEAHELGAMMAAVVAAAAGWRVLYLGPNTPARDLARAARESEARVIALGIVGHDSPGDVKVEVTELRRALGGSTSRTKVIAGGAAAANHRLTLKRARVEILASRTELRRLLNSLWTRGT